MGNGAKAAQKRDRNAKDAKKGPSSQLKTNEAAQSVKCKICFQTFQSTTKKPALETHAKDRHTKTYDDCFA
ncbi:DUF1909-domain-containing protein [Dissoconium aciculare CBS 342.82]|uniref:DUF1909-domain-containing protein n=1 Tax=Dissoconium aciculare CBS 342.82 TaxID=1314786 RepID=A0A6J3MCV3_9PEZI|nr:DUF1909-domain-containing protein [Dissoconium aciculare CBS 342.82]KAF1825855.1 DUF1909-domain-containing protein [Dissoconium aciculare CBS 342.82]